MPIFPFLKQRKSISRARRRTTRLLTEALESRHLMASYTISFAEMNIGAGSHWIAFQG